MRYVYLIAGPNSLYKIGQTGSTAGRLKGMARRRAGLRLVSSFGTGVPNVSERMVHRAFAHRRVRGEWFRLTEHDVGLFQRLAETYPVIPPKLVESHIDNARSGYAWGQLHTFDPAEFAFLARTRRKEPTEPVRMPQSVVKRVRRIASHLGKDPGDYIADRLTATLDKDEAKMLADIAKEREDGK